MNISLIGMSNAGKSYWSKKLEKKRFERICCDDMIEESLAKTGVYHGGVGTSGVSSWMGQPYEKRYKKRSEQYLQAERAVMREILRMLQDASQTKNIVIDTTGSIIYAGEDVLRQFRQQTIVVYLETHGSVEKDMYEAYLKHPKPVIWGDKFVSKNSESEYEALARCYPDLLRYRSTMYKALAHITFEYDTIRREAFSAEDLLTVITKASIL